MAGVDDDLMEAASLAASTCREALPSSPEDLGLEARLLVGRSPCV
jgi:hypothetical protein